MIHRLPDTDGKNSTWNNRLQHSVELFPSRQRLGVISGEENPLASKKRPDYPASVLFMEDLVMALDIRLCVITALLNVPLCASAETVQRCVDA